MLLELSEGVDILGCDHQEGDYIIYVDEARAGRECRNGTLSIRFKYHNYHNFTSGYGLLLYPAKLELGFGYSGVEYMSVQHQ